ncbi:MAG: hypothetical protein K8T90_09845 [Planctomycetes bacterium]|nr:hypothetical protein [Planctomycetota bacterium]
MRARTRCSGHTLADVLVASVLVGIFATISGGAARFMGVATSSLRDRARATGELRMATEYLRQDLGAAASLARTEDGALHIVREEAYARLFGGWTDGADAGVTYERRGQRLFRIDVASDTEVVAALDLHEFTVEERALDETAVLITAGTGSEARSLTLLWSAP